MSNMRVGIQTLVLVYVTALIGSGPFAFHVIINIIPQISSEYSATKTQSQMLLSAAIAALSISSLAFGILANKIGTKFCLILGMGLFLAGSSICVVSTEINWLIAGRTVQAIGAAAGPVMAPVILSDLYNQKNALRMLGLADGLFVLFPILAPIIGILAYQAGGTILALTLPAFLAITLLLSSILLLSRESRYSVQYGKEKDQVHIWKSVIRLLSSGRYLLVTINLSSAMTAYFVFTSSGPSAFAILTSNGPYWYSAGFMAICVSFLAGCIVSSRMSKKYALHAILLFGSGLSALSSITLLIVSFTGAIEPLHIIVASAMMIVGQGIAKPAGDIFAITLTSEPKSIASGLSLFMQMIASAVIVQAIASVGIRSDIVLASLMTSCSILMFLTACAIHSAGVKTADS